MTDLQSLLARVEKAEGADRELDYRIFLATAPLEQFSHWRPADPLSRYTASLDAALALCERVLPGWRWDISTFVTTFGGEPPKPQAFVVAPDHPAGRKITSHGASASPALALIAAMLQALVASHD